MHKRENKLFVHVVCIYKYIDDHFTESQKAQENERRRKKKKKNRSGKYFWIDLYILF